MCVSGHLTVLLHTCAMHFLLYLWVHALLRVQRRQCVCLGCVSHRMLLCD